MNASDHRHVGRTPLPQIDTSRKRDEMKNAWIKSKQTWTCLVLGIGLMLPSAATAAPKYIVTTTNNSLKDFDTFYFGEFMQVKDSNSALYQYATYEIESANTRLTDLERGDHAFRWSLYWDSNVPFPDALPWYGRGSFIQVPFTNNVPVPTVFTTDQDSFSNGSFLVLERGVYEFDTSVNFYEIENGSAAGLAIKASKSGTDVTLATESRTYKYNGRQFLLSLHTMALLDAGDSVRVEVRNDCDPDAANTGAGFKIGGPDILKAAQRPVSEWGSGDTTYFAGHLVSRR
jgi:hypothetical protein